MGPASRLGFTTFLNVINGDLESTAHTRNGVNPATKEPNPPVPVATSSDLDRAVVAAETAFQRWSQVPVEERRTALFAYADALNAEKEGFTNLLTREQGKPLAQAAFEVESAVMWIKGLASLELPETVLEETAERKIVQRFVPLGVAAAIVPWNFPVLLAIGKLTSALVTGNCIIIKPSPFTPYCALKLAELAIPFFPKGVVQALSGEDNLGPLLTQHPGIRKISFTGSTETGKLVGASCANTLKHCTLELGGNDPAIVCDNVDIDQVVPKLGVLCFLNCGQICMAIKRVYVHESVYEEFRDKLVAFVKSLPIGDGMDSGTFFGPIQNQLQYSKAKDLLESVASEGLKTALKGTATDLAGYFVHPTIVDNPPDDARVVVEEPFAPILPLLKWSTEEEVITRANAGPTGLGGSVWSRDLDRAHRLARRLCTGSVWVNTHFSVAPHVPFGGHKESGLGVEWGVEGLKAYCNSQTLWLYKNV
ncbi:hypothetical protein ETB97_007991 [Aspergillus alliaceus]|uniref:aldehyde dehydrogenase (NAD(+)) n=1 Tax=Petromyces alliaceus TaxID=209559 RepID=A0A8H5ZY94_PETAA|nr:hypothetical protein ETB97_007991 [Aspergillus burnettii]